MSSSGAAALISGETSALYQYQPLRFVNAIRLLKVHRQTCSSTRVEYSIEHHRLDAAPPYEVVSYVWGQTRLTENVLLRDGRLLSVTASMKKALPFLAQTCQTDYLWIDQITINQRDVAERSKQVSIMGRIYSGSRSCFVWLEIDPTRSVDADIALDWKNGIGRGIEEFLKSFQADEIFDYLNSPIEFSRLVGPSDNSEQLIPSSNIREHLFWFLQHPWFSRTWVYQEFVLPLNVVFLIRDFGLPVSALEGVFKLGWPPSSAWFGTLNTRLNIDKRLASLFNSAPGVEFLVAAFQSRSLLNGAERRRSHDFEFGGLHQPLSGFDDYQALTYGDMLTKMAASRAQDPRDHVYAFVGLAPFLLKHMKIDYALPVEHVFAAMMKALLIESRTLDFFDTLPAEADIAQSRYRLPSWVPNWTVSNTRLPMLSQDNLFMSAGEGYGLPNVSRCRHHVSFELFWNEISVAGHIIDKVSQKLHANSIYQHTSSLEIDVHHCEGRLPWERETLDDFLEEIEHYIPTDDRSTQRKALLRTLLMDGVLWAAITALTSGRDLYRQDIMIIGEKHDVKLNHVIEVLLGSTNPDMENLPHDASLQVLHELSRIQYRRRVVYCQKNKFGLAPDRVQKDDLIAILHNSRAPVLLRPVPRKPDRFMVIGQCYYDGAMYGELADPIDDNARTFILV